MTVTGKTGHAGTVPMDGRKDALVAAATVVLELNEAARSSGSVRATVGSFNVAPGVVNHIPDRVVFTLEIRAPNDRQRLAFRREMYIRSLSLAVDHGCEFKVAMTYEQKVDACDPGLTNAYEQAASQLRIEIVSLPSGATHDASAMADLPNFNGVCAVWPQSLTFA